MHHTALRHALSPDGILVLAVNRPEAHNASGVPGRAISRSMVEHTVKLVAADRDSEKGREGLGAFPEKRSPNWQR